MLTLRRTNFYIYKLKAALFMGAAFFILNSANAVQSESYKDIINKAYNLSLQQERKQAISLVNAAIKKESKNTTASKELKKVLEQITTLFYSESAQQSYELGLSVRRTNINQAIEKTNEALKKEADNLAVLLQLGRNQIYAGDCSASRNTALKAKEINPYYEPVDLLLAQAYYCLNQEDKYISTIQQVELKKSEYKFYWYLLETLWLIKKNSQTKLAEYYALLEKQKKDYPENYYIKWKAQAALKVVSDKFGQKYINTCKNLSPRQDREYILDPFLCKNTVEVEAVSKKTGMPE